jgi:hypothetical protein
LLTASPQCPRPGRGGRLRSATPMHRRLRRATTRVAVGTRANCDIPLTGNSRRVTVSPCPVTVRVTLWGVGLPTLCKRRRSRQMSDKGVFHPSPVLRMRSPVVHFHAHARSVHEHALRRERRTRNTPARPSRVGMGSIAPSTNRPPSAGDSTTPQPSVLSHPSRCATTFESCKEKPWIHLHAETHRPIVVQF